MQLKPDGSTNNLTPLTGQRSDNSQERKRTITMAVARRKRREPAALSGRQAFDLEYYGCF